MNLSRRFSNRSRSGFSLIEVILATAILMGSVVVLARLAGMGRTQAHKAALQTTAQQLCENTMNELLLGLRPLEPVDDQPLLPAESEHSGDLETLAAEQERLGSENQISESRDTLYGQGNRGEGNPEQESEWVYSVRLEPVDFLSSLSSSLSSSQSGNVLTPKVEEPGSENDGLQKLTVSVRQSDEELQRPVRFVLTRWIRPGETAITDEGNSFGLDSAGGFQ